MEKVDRTQYQAAPAITGTWQGTNRSKLYEELGWETLSDCRWCRRVLQIHNMEKYNTHSYLRDKLPPLRKSLYRLNISNIFQEIRCKNSFFPDTTSSWNNMISNFQDIPISTSLKSHLLSLTHPKIKRATFGIHDALGLRYLFQLRVNLSPTKGAITSSIHLLRLASVILVLKIFPIFYLNAPFMQFRE